MKKLKTLLIGSIVTTSASMAFAGASAGFDVNNAYIFRGGTINDEVNVQPGLDASIDEGALAGLAFGTWANFNTDTEQFDEIDYYASYSIAVTDEMSLDIGYTEYTYPTGASTNATGAAVGTDADREIYVSTGKTCPLTGADMSLGAYYGIDGGIEEALYIELGASKGMDICDSASVEGGVTVGIMGNQAKGSTADEGVSYVMLSLGTSMGDYINASVNYVIETDDSVLTVDEDFFVSVGTSIDF